MRSVLRDVSTGTRYLRQDIRPGGSASRTGLLCLSLTAFASLVDNGESYRKDLLNQLFKFYTYVNVYREIVER